MPLRLRPDIVRLPALVVNVFPSTSLNIAQLRQRRNLACCEVPSMDLGVNLNTGVLWNHLIGYGDPLVNGDTLVDNGVVLHIAHAQHAIDLGDAEPVEDIRHQGLEPHVLDACDVFRTLEILASPI
jgi:hypothetical protein